MLVFEVLLRSKLVIWRKNPVENALTTLSTVCNVLQFVLSKMWPAGP